MSVYFMREIGGAGLIKIGFSDQPERRVSTIKYQEEKNVEILAVIDGGRTVERMLHSQLEGDRVSGEWFEPTERVLELVKSAQSVAMPKRGGEAHAFDATAEDMQIAFNLIDRALRKLAGGESKYGALDKRVYPVLYSINPMWTKRRLRGLYGREYTAVPHWVVRNLIDLLERFDATSSQAAG
ncbi:hypothetical protein EVC14_052 [Rhizobium phage RHph_I3_18]|nr:hypothetical protein EVC14_052 [Rhizobium phage RHph_I3_18]